MGLGLAVAVSDPAEAQQAWLADWASSKQDEIRIQVSDSGAFEAEPTAPVYLEIPSRVVRRLQGRAAERRDQTIALYEDSIGANTPSSLLWTGVETGNPLTRDEQFRWNSLRDQGLFDPELRAKTISELRNLGLINVRLGLSNHEIDLDDESSWAEHDALIDDFQQGGISISLDLHHFGVEDRFRTSDADGGTIPEQSYYLHPDWPDYFARFAAAAFERYGSKIKAVTLINEPETTVGFNSEMWHGAFPGWGDRRDRYFYVERAFQIAKGALKARLAIERQMRRTGQRVFFMHTEAAVHKPDRPTFNAHVRFFPSDLILGQDWLMRVNVGALARAPLARLAADWARGPEAARSSLDWLVESYVIEARDVGSREALRDRLAAHLRELRELHRALARDYGKTMGDDTVFAVDYYAHNEDRGASGAWLSPEPQLYAEQMRSGERAGLYPLIVDYFNRYSLPVMIGETGTPFHYFGARWHQQMLLECAQAMADGVPMLGYTIYPLIDTHGWETALSVPKDRTLLNPGGVLDIALEPRPFIQVLLQALNNQTAQNAHQEPAQSVQ
jgi:hypothetical protein